MSPRLRVVTSDAPTDEDLLVSVSRGDGGAFELLVRRHGPRLAVFCGRHVGSASLGEDLAQDVFVALWDARARFAGGDALAWIYTFAVNRCRKHERRWLRWLRVATAETQAPPEPSVSPLEAYEQRALRSQLARAMEQLPPLQKEALLLRFEAQLDYRAVAQAAECSEGAARARTFDAIRSLRARFEESE